MSIRTSLMAGLALLVMAVALPAQAVTTAAWGGDVSRPAPLPPKPDGAAVPPDAQELFLHVEFRDGSGMRVRDGLFSGESPELDALNLLLAERGATPRRLFQQSEAWLDGWRVSGEARSGIVLHDLNLYHAVDLPSEGLVGETCDALNRLECVELAWPAPTGSDAVVMKSPAPPPPFFGGFTPDFQVQQVYRRAAPNGVDADFGNAFSGGRGAGTLIADCETGWTDDHEDLAHAALDNFVGFTPAFYPWDHGTAVLGEMVGEDNGSGVLGLCYDADVVMSTHTPDVGPQNIPAGVANGAAALSPGDALVIEIQCFLGPPSPHPCEYDPAIFATVQTATANGIHVFAAAGNGNQNLDSAAYGGAFDLQVKDSGAVLVGASNGVSLNKAGFSNYGSRVTSHGWGEDVVTTGYGDLQGGGATQEYTSGFSGTSSATPIVTGAGVVLNGIHREAFGSDIDPIALRALLADTGTPQGTGGQIGSRPDLAAAIRELGVPEIQLSVIQGPPKQLQVTSLGEPGDVYVIFWATGLGATAANLPPYGDLYLDPLTTTLLTTGVIGPGGTAVDTYNVSAQFSGVVSWFQGGQLFNTRPGVGSFSNVVRARAP